MRERLRPILFNPWTLATVLYAIAVREYGESEVHSWEPETLALEFKDDYGEELPKINQDKLNALIAAVVGPGFYHDWAAFMAIAQTLNHGEDPDDMGDPLLVAEMCWAVTEVKLNDDTPGRFSQQVASFVGQVLHDDGFVKAPPQLAFAKMPEQYLVKSPGDEGKEETLSTEHAGVAAEYVREQSLLLLQQVSALPWHDDASIQALTVYLRESS